MGNQFIPKPGDFSQGYARVVNAFVWKKRGFVSLVLLRFLMEAHLLVDFEFVLTCAEIIAPKRIGQWHRSPITLI